MRQDWVEFKINGDTYSVRPEYIVAFETAENGYTKLFMDSGSLKLEFDSSESYEQVKQKLLDADKADWSKVEHFTKEEYDTLRLAVTNAGFAPEYEKPLLDKLNEILKEKNETL